MLEYDKIRYLGDASNSFIFNDEEDEIVVTEKMDGANFRFMLEDGKLVFGSRKVELEKESQWSDCINFIKEQINDNIFKYQGLTFFGECMKRHTIKYNDNIPMFIGFDVYDGEKFIDNPEEIFEDIGLTFVPIIGKYKVKDIGELDESFVPKSIWNDDLAEGIVLKNYEKQVFAKIVRKKFKEENRLKFGGSPRFSKNDTEKVFLKFCTKARVEKIIYKLHDQGNEIGRPLMKDLIHAVKYDIMEEEWKSICLGTYKIDFKLLTTLIAKKCIVVLDDLIIRR